MCMYINMLSIFQETVKDDQKAKGDGGEVEKLTSCGQKHEVHYHHVGHVEEGPLVLAICFQVG